MNEHGEESEAPKAEPEPSAFDLVSMLRCLRDEPKPKRKRTRTRGGGLIPSGVREVLDGDARYESASGKMDRAARRRKMRARDYQVERSAGGGRVVRAYSRHVGEWESRKPCARVKCPPLLEVKSCPEAKR